MNFPPRLQVVRRILLFAKFSLTITALLQTRSLRSTSFYGIEYEFSSTPTSRSLYFAICKIFTHYYGVTSNSFASLNFVLRKIHKKKGTFKCPKQFGM